MSSCCGGSGASKAASTAGAASGAVFQIEDMSCSHCVGVISRALDEGMPGVPYTVDLEAHRVTVAGDPAVADALIRDAGYEPRLLPA